MELHILFAVSDKLRRAINYHHGRSGQATRQEVKAGCGSTVTLGMTRYLPRCMRTRLIRAPTAKVNAECRYKNQWRNILG